MNTHTFRQINFFLLFDQLIQQNTQETIVAFAYDDLNQRIWTSQSQLWEPVQLKHYISNFTFKYFHFLFYIVGIKDYKY